jgi:predicted ArsR family transcriptional regulator
MPTSNAAAVSALALLDEPTRRRLYEFVVGSRREIGRDEAAAAVGISRMLAAFHLDRLTEAGLLVTTYRRLTGRSGPGAGRPAKLYARAPGSITVSLPARRYEELAEVFAESLDRLAHDGPQADRVVATVFDTAREHGRADAAEHSPAVAPRAPDEAREALLELLTDDGFEPSVDPTTKAITLRNCPYQAVSAEHRDMTCGMNVAWAEGVLETLEGTGLSARLAPDPGRCCVVFSPQT